MPFPPPLSRCAVITEFARDVLAQRGVKVVVPGEKERVVVSLAEETNEADVQMEEKNGAEEPAVTAAVGEKCDVRGINFLQCNGRGADFIAVFISKRVKKYQFKNTIVQLIQFIYV